jgi:hypothetical protein
MEKILLPVNAAKINMPVLDFAAYLAKLTNSALTVIFMESVSGEPEPVVKWTLGAPYVETVLTADIPHNREMLRLYEQNERLLKDACSKRGINATIHANRHISSTEIIAESRFADLIIADADLSFSERTEGAPSAFTKELLAKSECPVIIAPSGFDAIEEIAFAYDGSASAVFAIKQFIYLFPEFADKKITILHVNKKEEEFIVQKDKIGALLQHHYSNIGFHHLTGDAADALFEFLLGKRNMFVVMGAYGAHMFSRVFKASTSDLVLKTINLPVFIAHHNR